jgi:hypothetical protein
VKPPVSRYRGNPANEVGEADGVIRTAPAFWSTVGNAAGLHRVERDHLADKLRRAGRPGGGPVTAELIYRTAAALAAGQRRWA